MKTTNFMGINKKENKNNYDKLYTKYFVFQMNLTIF